MSLPVAERGPGPAGDRFAIPPHRLHTFADMTRILHFDLVRCTPELARDTEPIPAVRDTGVDDQTVMRRAGAEDVLSGGPIRPGGRARQPAVARQPELRGLVARDVLR